MTHATDIVAYTYQAELLCPACTYLALTSGESRDVLIDRTRHDVIRDIGVERGIDVDDEDSFDSSEFPKVVFADQAYHCEDCRDYEYVACDHCGEPIVND